MSYIFLNNEMQEDRELWTKQLKQIVPSYKHKQDENWLD